MNRLRAALAFAAMSDAALSLFPPSRQAALERLARFLPKAGRRYTSRRNFDLGPGHHEDVSTLSPYLRCRLLTEDEVITAVLGRHSLTSAEKFVQEVFWRTYWKGWLELHPQIWRDYQAGLGRALDDVQTQSGLRSAWEDACHGQTGIAAFDHWALELGQTGYLHNHARMWFASIWVFTLRLPWELGADFFLRHLLDGDPASNTLSWRWVAGLQTRGKTYLARPANIEKYTEGRFRPEGLATEAPALDGPPPPPRMAPPVGDEIDPARPTLLVLHEDDLSPAYVFGQGIAPVATVFLDSSDAVTPLTPAPHVKAFRQAAMQDVAQRWKDRLGPCHFGIGSAEQVTAIATTSGADQIVTPYAPTGPAATMLGAISGRPLFRALRPYDARAWPHATAGFFKFKKQIPALAAALRGLEAV